MNNPVSLLLTAALVLGAAQTASAQSAAPSIPTATPSVPASASSTAPGNALGTPQVSGTDNRLVPSNVSIEIGSYAGPLSSLLAAVAKSAGYDVIFDTNVDALTPAQTAAGTAGATGTASGAKPVVYNFRNTPFNQVWPLLMDIYGLSYDLVQVGNTTVLRVGTNPVQRVIALRNASAVDAVNQIKLFFGTPTYTETPQRDAQGNVVGTTRTLADVKLDSPTLRIVADARSNALIVRGTNREVNEVARLAAQLDSSGGSAVNGSDGTPGAGTASQTVQRVYSVKGQTSDITALLASQYPNLRVTPVGATGQLVITGPQNQLDAALGLLQQVDVPPRSQAGTVQRVFSLVNADAVQVKAVLDGTLARDLTGTTAPLSNSLITGGTPVIQPDGTTVITPPATTTTGSGSSLTPTTAQTASNPAVATIIADQRTNTLIVRGTQTQVNQIAEIIPTLDVKVPQINMQVRIQEITDVASRSLGVNWNAGFGNFVTKIISGTLTSIFDPTTSLAGFNLGATLTALESQNLTKRVYDGSITMQSGQRAGVSGGTQNASNGAAAHIQSGGRLEINIPSSAANVAGISKQIDYGVTLDFFNPQVAPDGSITVQVRGIVNQPLTNLDSVSAATIPNLLRFSNSEAQTTITFRNGETVLLSGLLGTTDTTDKTGVPFLSSLPVIGQAFSTTTNGKTRTQLLVVITGNVIR